MFALLPFLFMPITVAFVAPQFTSPKLYNSKDVIIMMAEGGPPQYAKRSASVVSNVEVGKGSCMIRVKVDDDEPLDYQPGHVLALEIPDPENEGEWMKGPYTVSRADESSFDVLYRVVGKKTETFRSAKVDATLQFGGKFKVPILEGINQDGLERVVGISTGVGIGPLIGFAEEALSQQEFSRIDLYVAFKEREDICCVDVLDELTKVYPTRFSWTPIISSTHGHTSAPENLKLIAERAPTKAGTTHYHMIGNGSMVNEWKAGLANAGVAKERVTLEMYFNHKVAPRPEAVEDISEALKEVTLASK